MDMSRCEAPYDDEVGEGFVVVDEVDDPEVPLEELFPGATVVRGVGADPWDEQTEAQRSSRAGGAPASPRLGRSPTRAEASLLHSIADDVTAASTPHTAATAAAAARADSCDERDDAPLRRVRSSESTHTKTSTVSNSSQDGSTAARSHTTPGSPIDDIPAMPRCTDSYEPIASTDARDSKAGTASGTMPRGVAGVPQGVSVRIAPTTTKTGMNIEVELSLDHDHCGHAEADIARDMPSCGHVARGRVVLILGPTASGKTSLVRQATERARSEGLVVVTSEESVSWDPSRAVVSQFGSAVS